uniref:Uncharacterized protein n=1 Tax=Caenorhabditis japonica TaxID=281687 RepID=A0A8R1E0E1_CAEJA
MLPDTREAKLRMQKLREEEKSKQDANDPDSPPEKQPKVAEKKFELPIEVVQCLQQLCSPKPSHNGPPVRPQPMKLEDGNIILPQLPPLQQLQQLQQIQNMIQYHEQQVKYRSYMQLEVLRQLRKQLSEQMMVHPTRAHYEALVDAAKNNELTPLSTAEKAQIEYFTSMADWTLEARSILQDKESPFYLFIFGRQVADFKNRINEIQTHEQFLVFAPLFAERIDYHRELINTLNRRVSCSVY